MAREEGNREYTEIENPGEALGFPFVTESRVAYCCDIMHHYGGFTTLQEMALRLRVDEDRGETALALRAQISGLPRTALS